MMHLSLTKPDSKYKNSFWKAIQELREAKEDRFFRDIGSPETPEAYIILTQLHERGENLPKLWGLEAIPYSIF